MRFNFFLAFILILTLLSTAFFTISSTAGELVIRDQINTFFRSKLNIDFSISSFEFTGRELKLSLSIRKRDVLKVYGRISYEELVADIDYKVINGDLEWLKGVENSLIFSSNGKIKLSLSSSEIHGELLSSGEKLSFSYQDRRVTGESSLKIFTKNFPVEILEKFTSLNIFGKRASIDATFHKKGNLLVSKESTVLIDGFGARGDFKYNWKTLLFNGFSYDLGGEVNFKIDEKSSLINLNGVLIGKIISKFSNHIPVRGKIDLELREADGGFLEFSGNINELALERSSIVEYIDKVFKLELLSSPLYGGKFFGEINNNFVIFDMDISKGEFEFRVNGGSYGFSGENLYLPLVIEKDYVSLGKLSIETPSNRVKAELSPFGDRLVRDFLLSVSKKRNYGADIEGILNMVEAGKRE
jgi:hypothetical protein